MHRRSASALLALALAGATVVGTSSTAQAEDTEVFVRDNRFEAPTIQIVVGDTVTWTWDGNNPHDVQPDGHNEFEASEVQREGTFQATFDNVGTFEYFCSIHGNMDGTVEVFASTPPDDEPTDEPTEEPTDEPTEEPSDEPRGPARSTFVRGDGTTAGASIAWSQFTFPDGTADTVLLAREDLFADPLASGGVQGRLDAPLLLVPAAPAGLSQRVADEITRLGATNAIILGGPMAVSDQTVADLQARGIQTERVFGDDRIRTATAMFTRFHANATEAILIRGFGTADDPTRAFADSLTAGGAAARANLPILLSQSDRLSDATRDTLAASSVTKVHLVGGTSALSAQVVADLQALGIEVVRLAGDDRYLTSRAVVEAFYPTPVTILLVDATTPQSWAVGAAGATAAESSPIAAVANAGLPDHVRALLEAGTDPVCAPDLPSGVCEEAFLAAQDN